MMQPPRKFEKQYPRQNPRMTSAMPKVIANELSGIAKPAFPMRINKFLALRKDATRRGADEIIKKNQVFINGRLAVLGDKVQESDKVEIRFRGKSGPMPSSSPKFSKGSSKKATPGSRPPTGPRRDFRHASRRTNRG